MQVYSREAACVVAVCDRYLLQVIKERTTVATVSVMRRALTDLKARYGCFGFLCLAEPEAHLLNSSVNGAIQDVASRFAASFTASVVVLEKEGFLAAAVRSLIRTAQRTSGATHPAEVVARLSEGATFIAQHTAEGMSAAGIIEAVNELRAADVQSNQTGRVSLPPSIR